ncbi:MAG TPA: MMPL family transporter [Enhygromyxa sp.]|nr:MMPL family transporter [Enhygromyxa sp.]
MTGPGALARALGRWVAWITRSKRNSGLTVLIAVLLATAALGYGKSIRVDTDLRALLPKTAPSVVALDELEQRSGASERFIVAIEARTPEDADAMAKGIAEEIASWPEAEQLSIVRDYTAIRDHALYFIELEQLETLRDELDAQRKRAVARAMGPGLTDGEIDPDAVSGSDWDDPEFEDLDWGSPPEQPEQPPADQPPEPESKTGDEFDIDAFLDEQRARLVEQSGLDEDEIAIIWPNENKRGEIEWQDRVGRPYANTDGTVRTVQASLSRPATDVEFAQEVVRRIERRADLLRETRVAADTRAEVVAAYDVSAEVDTILRDARRATWISTVAVLTVLIVGFRSGRAIALVAVPMSVSMVLTLAVAKLAFGELNALTVFLFAVLFGMGVDFSVHLFALRERQGRTADWPKVVTEHLRPLGSTMLTTSGALAVLTLAEFKAFREFGIISAIGVAVCLIAALLLVPATDTLLGPLWRRSVGPRAVRPREPIGPRTVKLIRAIRAAAIVGVAVLGVIGAPRLEMEKDTRAFKTKRAQDHNKIAYATTSSRCSKTLALVAATPEDLDLAVERLTAEQGRLLPGAIDTGEPRRPWVGKVYSLRTLMPTEQQAKAAVIGQVGARTNDFLAELPDLDEEARRHQTHLEALERLTKPPPLAISDLPDWAVDPFRERDGTTDRIAHVCLDIAGWSIDELVAVRHRLDQLFEGVEVRSADSRLVFADLMVLVEHDARRLPIVALLVILGFIAVDLRRVGPTVICFATLALGIGLVLAIMGLWPLRLNFFNVVVMPAVVGLGIDASIHLWHARERASLDATGKASVLAALTTVAGFSGLLAAEHAGLRSIGEVGVVAIVACVVVAFLALYPIARSGRS